jgi:hypothetical protein
VPAGGDVYVMKRVIHDWDDERSITILKNCHRAMAGKGKLLLIEMEGRSQYATAACGTNSCLQFNRLIRPRC